MSSRRQQLPTDKTVALARLEAIGEAIQGRLQMLGISIKRQETDGETLVAPVRESSWVKVVLRACNAQCRRHGMFGEGWRHRHGGGERRREWGSRAGRAEKLGTNLMAPAWQYRGHWLYAARQALCSVLRYAGWDKQTGMRLMAEQAKYWKATHMAGRIGGGCSMAR